MPDARPEEPIVALDDVNELDLYALECPVDRAIEVVATCFASDPFTKFFAKPGHEVEFVNCLLRFLRTECHLSIYECCTFTAVALVSDECEEYPAQIQPKVSDYDALAEVIDREGTAALGMLGFSMYEACLLSLVPKEVLRSFLTYRRDRRRLLHQYAEECGRQVLHIQFLATSIPQQHHGLASKLLRHITATADAHNKDCFIENTQKAVVGLLVEHGFRPWRRCPVEGEGAPEIELMVRPAKGAGG